MLHRRSTPLNNPRHLLLHHLSCKLKNDNANIQLEDSSDEDVPELVPNTDIHSSDSDSDEAYRIHEKRIRLPTKRRYLAYSNRVSYSSVDSTDEEAKCQHKPLHRDTWTVCPRNIEQ